MKSETKKRINLTINPAVFSKAQQLVKKRGKSLSQVVEDYLNQLNLNSEVANNNNWLNKFHQKYLTKSNSEKDIEIALEARIKKYL